jgi:uncharacterized membrane protein YraQ (UPF0718 family)
MDSCILYGAAGLLLLLSGFRNKDKTKAALRKAWKSFDGILPQFLSILLLVGLLLAVFSTETISRIIGPESGWLGVLAASAVGSVTLIPGFVAFAMSAELLHGGAGYMQIAAFISTLMMVGVATLPLEISYFGRKTAFLRNFLSFLFSFLVALIMELVM